jgi:hypothetical protein
MYRAGSRDGDAATITAFSTRMAEKPATLPQCGLWSSTTWPERAYGDVQGVSELMMRDDWRSVAFLSKAPCFATLRLANSLDLLSKSQN